MNIVSVTAFGHYPLSHPLEVAVVLPNGQYLNEIVRPPDAWALWSLETEKTHGLSLEKIMDEGKSPEEVCDRLNAFCHGRDLYSDSWLFEHAWIKKLFRCCGRRPAFSCHPLAQLVRAHYVDAWSGLKYSVIGDQEYHARQALDQAMLLSELIERLLLGVGVIGAQGSRNDSVSANRTLAKCQESRS